MSFLWNIGKHGPLHCVTAVHTVTIVVCRAKTVHTSTTCPTCSICVLHYTECELFILTYLHYCQCSWLKPGAVVIDVGINSVDDPSSKKGKYIQYMARMLTGVLYCTFSQTHHALRLVFHPVVNWCSGKLYYFRICVVLVYILNSKKCTTLF